MSKYKQSFYNINLVEDGYVRGTNEGITPYYNIRTGKFGYIPDNLDLTNPPQDLLQDGFIIPSHIDEQESYRQAQINAITDDFPSKVFLTICVTSKCNFHCAYCFQGTHNYGIHMQGEVLQDTIAYIKKEIDRNTKLNTFVIGFFGGEPLLNMPAIREISKFVIPYCKEKNIKYRAFITTNGYFLSNRISLELKELNIKYARVTIDGLGKDYINLRQAPEDAYDKLIKNFENSEIPLLIRINVTRQNQENLRDILVELSKLKAVQDKRDKIVVARVKEFTTPLQYGFSDEEWLALSEHRRDYIDILPLSSTVSNVQVLPCDTIQKRNIVIDADGYLYHCENNIGNHKYSVGTLKTGVNSDSKVDKLYVKSTITEECMKCKYLPICCGGKCRYEELHFGKPCKEIKGRFRQNMQDYLTYVSPI